jgi:hypothetical protein
VTVDDLKDSLSQANPPPGLTPPLAGLWWAARDDWDKAHKIVMDEGGKDCAWVHAYLHRVEGDIENAGYWYRQAGRLEASGALSAEWEKIVEALLVQLAKP